MRLDESDDCFALFDAVFSALSTELQWDERAADAVEEPPPAGPAAPAGSDTEEVRLTLALEPADVATPVRAEPDVVPASNVARFDRAPSGLSEEDLAAFDGLDARVAVPAPVTGRADAAPVRDRSDGRFDAALDLIDETIDHHDTWADYARRVEPKRVENGPDGADWFDSVVDRLDGALLAPAAPAMSVISPAVPVPAAVPATGESPTPRPLPALGSGRLERAFAVIEALSDLRARMGGALTPALRDETSRLLADARALAADLQLATAAVRVEFAVAALGRGSATAPVQEIDELVRHLRHDLRTWSIWPVSASRAWTLNLRLPTEAEAAFPSARADVAEAGVCLGLARYGAALFHLTRAGRRGVRALARAADAAAAPPAGRDGYDALIAVIEARVHDVESWPSGAARTHALAFFGEGLDDARALREWARRLDPDADAPVDERDVLAALAAVTRLLTRLSGRIDDRHDRTLGKRDFAKAVPARQG